MPSPIDLELFKAIPGNNLLLLADRPVFTIVAISNDLAQDRRSDLLIGKRLPDILPNIFANKAPGYKAAIIACLDELLAGNGIAQSSTKPKNGHSRELPVSFSARPLYDPDGSVSHIILTIHKTAPNRNGLSHRKTAQAADSTMAESQFQTLVTAAPIGIALFEGRELVVQMANEKMRDLWGKGDDVIGKKFTEVLPELQRHDLLQIINNVYTNGEVYQTTESPTDVFHLGVWKRGYYDFSFTPLFDADGNVYAVLNIATEVTERVATRLALEESESNHRNMIMQAPVAMLILEGEQMIVKTINERMLEMIGKTIDILNQPLLQALPELEGQQGYESFLRVFSSGEPVYGTEILVPLLKDGIVEERYFNFAYTPITKNGEIIGVMDVATEVTDQVKARKRIEESEALLQTKVEKRTADLDQQKAFIGSILDASLNGIYSVKAIYDAAGTIVDFEYLFANKVITNLLDLDIKDVIGASLLRLLPEIRENGFFALFCKLLADRQTYRDETYFVFHDVGHWFDYVIIPLNQDTLGISVEDITEKKHAGLVMEEQRKLLDNIMRNSSNGISVSKVFRNEEGRVVDALTILANEAAVNFIGLPRDIYLTKRATEIEPGIIGTPYYKACINTLETGEPFVMQYEMQSTSRWLELTVSRMDHDHLIQIFTDVTQIKTSQLQLEKSLEDLRRSNENLEQFAYAASHDLKEPMRKVQIFSDRLRDRLGPKLEKEDAYYFERILQATHRMNTLIEDLLLYSHVSKTIIAMERVDLNEKVRLVLEDLELEIAEKDAVITVDPLPVIQGHRRQLQQLFQNLVGNALKYAKSDVQPRVHIGSRYVDNSEATFPVQYFINEDGYHLISVTDNGIGFEAKNAEQIFKVFTRLHSNKDYKGSGVGLSIAQKVVENHKGSIWAESVPGEGANFYVVLPVSTAATA